MNAELEREANNTPSYIFPPFIAFLTAIYYVFYLHSVIIYLSQSIRAGIFVFLCCVSSPWNRIWSMVGIQWIFVEWKMKCWTYCMPGTILSPLHMLSLKSSPPSYELALFLSPRYRWNQKMTCPSYSVGSGGDSIETQALWLQSLHFVSQCIFSKYQSHDADKEKYQGYRCVTDLKSNQVRLEQGDRDDILKLINFLTGFILSEIFKGTLQTIGNYGKKEFQRKLFADDKMRQLLATGKQLVEWEKKCNHSILLDSAKNSIYLVMIMKAMNIYLIKKSCSCYIGKWRGGEQKPHLPNRKSILF